MCLDDREALLLLTKAAEDFARATVPEEVFRAFMTAMIALEKRVGCAALPQVLYSDDWSPRLWQDKLSRQHVPFSNLHFPHAWESIVWDA